MKNFILYLVIALFLTSCVTKPDYLENTVRWSTPGLFTAEGKPYQSPKPNKVTGKRLVVTDFGAVANDESADNSKSFKEALESANPGDEIFIPSGDYYFSGKGYFSKHYIGHIMLKSGVNITGEDRETTRLISNYKRGENLKYGTSMMVAVSQSDMVISNLTITSVVTESDLPDPNLSNYNNIAEGAPLYGVVIDNRNPIQTHGNIVIDNLLVEKFDRTGIRIRAVRDIRVLNTTVQTATDLGAGGAGYGIAIQGIGPASELTDGSLDTIYNVVENCTINGPYLRHGILVQYFSHNNLITNNTITGTLLDAIDMHGEDEFSNEISFNTISGVRKGAGIGIGNSGSTHDASGPYNYVYQNTIKNSERGIDILYGSPDSLIIENTLDNLKKRGIYLRDAPGTVLRGNRISNITSEKGYGVEIDYAINALEPEKGVPHRIKIQSNEFSNMANGIFVETHTEDFVQESNIFTGIKNLEFEDRSAEFILPEVSDVVIPKTGTEIQPVADNFITSENKNRVQSQNNMKLKASTYEPQYNRMVFMKFDIADIILDDKKVYLKFAAKSKDGMANLAISGSTAFTDWSEDKITWENTPYHEEDTAKTVDDGTLTHITDFTFPIVSNDFSTYYVDITDYVQNLKQDLFTIIISNNAVESMYCEVYSKEIKNQNFKPGLIFTK